MASGEGFLLDIGKEKGLLMWGNELHRSVCNHLKKKGFKIICGDLTKKRINKKFDIIIMSQIIEHLHNCNLFLNRVHTLLKHSGFLVKGFIKEK